MNSTRSRKRNQFLRSKNFHTPNNSGNLIQTLNGLILVLIRIYPSFLIGQGENEKYNSRPKLLIGKTPTKAIPERKQSPDT